MKKAGTLAGEVYGKDIRAAKTPEAQAALGKKLLRSAIDEHADRAARYALLGLATDLAAQAGDIETAFAAADELAKSFAVDALKTKADTLAKLERAKSADAMAMEQQCARLIDEALAADRYDVARQVAELAIDLARKNGTSLLAAAARQQDVKAIEAGYEQAQKARAVLDADSNNTAAYLTLGRFYCLAKGDWEKGVPLLANSSDKALKAVADLELAKPAEPARQIAVADGWRDLARKEPGLAHRRLREHAAAWYRKALPNVTGVLKLKAEIRLEELQPTEESPAWIVIFRSDDPGIWNTSVNEGPNRFAVALARVPNDIRFLRMTCAGKAVIVPISKPQLGATNQPAGAVGWDGRGVVYDGGRHVGLFSTAYPAGPGSAVILVGGPAEFSGWGFGHKHSGHVPAYAWDGKPIDRAVFEIAVTASITPDEARHVLPDKPPRKAK
ncbi:MAG: hypothetical protein NT031_02590 [Planctomycetota bacterium]|nr:hypothetical protein [Planctomycetota bacterium]